MTSLRALQPGETLFLYLTLRFVASKISTCKSSSMRIPLNVASVNDDLKIVLKTHNRLALCRFSSASLKRI